MKLKLLSLGIATLALLASLTIRADEKPVMLKRAYKKGDVTRVKVESTVDSNGTDVLVTLTSKLTVKDVKDDGKVVLEIRDEAGKVNVNGSDMDIPGGPLTTLTFDKAGKLVEFKAEEGGILTPEIHRLMETMRMPILPGKETKAGESWDSEFDNPAVKGRKFTVKTTYLGTEKVGDADLWKIKQAGNPDTDASGARMGYDATFWLDPANGQLVKAEIKITDQPTTRYGVQSMVTKVRQIKGDTK